MRRWPETTPAGSGWSSSPVRPATAGGTSSKQQGLQVLAYVPHNAYLVWAMAAAEDVADRLDATGFVRWHGAVPLAAKRSPGVEPTRGVVDLMVLHVRQTGAADLPALVATLGGVFERAHPAQPDGRLWIAVVRIDADRVPTLMAEDSVVWVEPAPGKPEFGGEMSSLVVSGSFDATSPAPGYRSWLDDERLRRRRGDVGGCGLGRRSAPPRPRWARGHLLPGLRDRTPRRRSRPRRPRHAGGEHRPRNRSGGGYTDPDGFLWGLGVAPGAQPR